MTGPVRSERPLVDADSLRRYLDANVEGPPELIEIERHLAGHSCETFFVTRGERRLVLRRPPSGAFLPTAHDVLREYRVLDGLARTAVRSPRPLLACEDDRVLGAPFYLMERVDGAVVRDALPAPLDARVDLRPRLGEELVDALAELHAVDPRAAAFEGRLERLARPTGYIERQLRRWRGQLGLTEPFSRRIDDLHAVADWLDANAPTDGETTVVHGDYKLDNVAFDLTPAEEPAGTGPRLAAIFDWEMATLGDPLADVGWMLSFWREPHDEAEPVMDRQTVTQLPGFQGRDELLARYQMRTGRRVDPEVVRPYVVLAIWKLAILLEGSYARHLAGATDDPFFAHLEDGVPALARRALAVAHAS